MQFSDLNIDHRLIEAISYMGFETATPIQSLAIPAILEQKDLLACAQTGTGKTAAFVLPILHELIHHPTENTSCLIIVPTRELAIQINQEIQGFAYFASIGSVAIYGGGDGGEFTQQTEALQNGVDIVVATPGRFISHLAMGHGNFSNLKYLILDEADKMLDMGFMDDIERIISHLPADRQTLMFSATMPDKIRKLARKILKNPFEISLSLSKPADHVVQRICLVYDHQKIPLLDEVLQQRPDYDAILIFTSAKHKVNEIVSSLKKLGYSVRGISSDLDQERREEVFRAFRSKQIRILVATDIISRGIDIKDINMVINFDVPHDAEDYVHRIGRTARAQSEGEALTLVNEKEQRKIDQIERLIEASIERMPLPEKFGEAPAWNVQKKQHSAGHPSKRPSFRHSPKNKSGKKKS